MIYLEYLETSLMMYTGEMQDLEGPVGEDCYSWNII